MVPKSRLDALTDGVFAFAMTLLVIDLRLPEHFHPAYNTELVHQLIALWHQAFVYVLSFYVLASCWLGRARAGSQTDMFGQEHIALSLAYLLFITFVPFSTMVVGRYAFLPIAVWLYAMNMALLALTALRLAAISNSPLAVRRNAQFGLTMLTFTAGTAVLISFWQPRWAMLAYGINLFEKPVRHVLRRNDDVS